MLPTDGHLLPHPQQSVIAYRTVPRQVSDIFVRLHRRIPTTDAAVEQLKKRISNSISGRDIV
jgi:hypothetical protein